MSDDHPFSGVRAQPLGATAPQPWLLGSSALTAQLAAQFGLPYRYAYFFHDGDGCAGARDAYRTTFQPSRYCARPLANLRVWVYAAPTSERAERLFLPCAHWRLDRDRTLHRPFPGPAELATRTLSAREEERVEQLRRTTVHGSAEVTAARLRRLAEEFAVDEIVVVTMTHDPADRLLSYRLIAAEMGAAPVNMHRLLTLVESIS